MTAPTSQRSPANRYVHLVSLCLLSVLVACTEAAPAVPPPPDGARALPATGRHEVRTDLAVAELYDSYGPHFGRMQATSYLLPGDATWAAVEAHYARALSDWEADARFPPRTGRITARTWVSGKRVLVAELFDAGRSRVLVVATNASAAR